jgi:putative transposase
MRKSQKQIQLDLFKDKISLSFGGDLLKNKRKSARPLSTRDPIHLVLRAERSNLRRHGKQIRHYWGGFSKRFGVKTYESSLNSNHIHAVIRIHSRRMYTQFIQALCGALTKTLQIKWKVRPFTRIISGWGKAYKAAKDYARLNFLEANGYIDYKPRRSRYPT